MYRNPNHSNPKSIKSSLILTFNVNSNLKPNPCDARIIKSQLFHHVCYSIQLCYLFI
jgi:hypothetical protein